ncbi:MAG TPA: carotenoid oxygenase family protein [Rhizomicrobium sp.]|jgi:carotenoid cleavage dioxygenase
MHPYLSKGYEPLRTECERAHLEIEGRLPAGLDGTFYRVGPSPQFEPRGLYNPLGGDGMVHAFRIRDERVSYRNRWVRTARWKREHEAGRALFGTTGNPADADPSVAGVPTDGVANTNIVWHANTLLALEEGNVPFSLDPVSLDTHGHHTFAGALPRNMTAHPKIDPVTGEMLFFANFQNIHAPRDIAFHVADASGAVVRSETITGPFAALVHDFAITEDFAIFAFCPVTVAMKRMLEGGPLIAWEPELGTHVGIVRRDTGAVRWFEGDACMAWHSMNAFNEGGRIAVDVCPQEAPMFPFADGTPPDPGRAAQYLTRWEFDWNGPAHFTATRLNGDPCEYPRIDERRTGRAYRHGYVACIGGPGTGDIFQRGIGHYDHTAGMLDLWNAGAQSAVAEPVFVAKHGSSREGEGFLLTNVFDETRNASHLAIFDAENVAAGPVARAHLDHRVPVGFHACWRRGG